MSERTKKFWGAGGVGEHLGLAGLLMAAELTFFKAATVLIPYAASNMVRNFESGDSFDKLYGALVFGSSIAVTAGSLTVIGYMMFKNTKEAYRILRFNA